MYTRAAKEYLKFLGEKFVTRSNHLDVQEFLATKAATGIRTRTVIYKLYSMRIFFDFLLEVLYGTGCRTGEVRTMLIENVDFENRRIRVEGKSGARIVLFSKHAEKALRSYIGERRKGYVFVSTTPLQSFRPTPSTAHTGWGCHWKRYDQKGEFVGLAHAYIPARKRMNYQEAWAHFAKLGERDRPQRPLGIQPLSDGAIQKQIQKVGLRAGVKVNPRNLRHTFATHLLENGADIRVVQDLMGHKNIMSTQVYTHVSKTMAARAFEQFDPRARLELVKRKARRR
jgi:site-specific recombinase XerD